MITTLLTFAVFALALLAAWLWARNLAAIDRAGIIWRIAMDFIAEEQCDMPHEFAACFVAGNHAAIQRKFPGFAAYVARRTAEPETDTE